MGLSVAIAGAIVMVTIMFILFTVPNVVNNIFSVGDASVKASLLGDTILHMMRLLAVLLKHYHTMETVLECHQQLAIGVLKPYLMT